MLVTGDATAAGVTTSPVIDCGMSEHWQATLS